MQIARKLASCLFTALALAGFATSATAQTPSTPDSTGTNGSPVFNVTIASTSTADQRLSAANSRVTGHPSGYRFWIKYSDNKYEEGKMVGNNMRLNGEIKDSTAAWYQFWAVNAGICVPPGFTVNGHWQQYQMLIDNVVVDQGWDFIVDSIDYDETPTRCTTMFVG